MEKFASGPASCGLQKEKLRRAGFRSAFNQRKARDRKVGVKLRYFRRLGALLAIAGLRPNPDRGPREITE